MLRFFQPKRIGFEAISNLFLSVLSQKFIQVEDRARDHRPGRHLILWQVWRRWCHPRHHHFVGGFGVLSEYYIVSFGRIEENCLLDF